VTFTVTPPGLVSLPAQPIRPFHSAHGRARAVVILLGVSIAIHFVLIPLDGLSLFLPEVDADQDLSGNPGGVVVLLVQGLGELLSAGVYVATIIIFLMWLYRCYTNLPAFVAYRANIGYSPGWAVGSFFVPFANLFVPYQATKELWRKSQSSDELLFAHATSPPGFFPALVGILAHIQFRQQRSLSNDHGGRPASGHFCRRRNFGHPQHCRGRISDDGSERDRSPAGRGEQAPVTRKPGSAATTARVSSQPGHWHASPGIQLNSATTGV